MYQQHGGSVATAPWLVRVFVWIVFPFHGEREAEQLNRELCSACRCKFICLSVFSHGNGQATRIYCLIFWGVHTLISLCQVFGRGLYTASVSQQWPGQEAAARLLSHTTLWLACFCCCTVSLKYIFDFKILFIWHKLVRLWPYCHPVIVPSPGLVGEVGPWKSDE